MPEGLEGSYIFFDAGVTVTKGALINDAEPLKSEGSSLGVFGFRPDGAAIFLNHDSHVARLTWSDDQFNYSPLALWHSGPHDFYAYYPYESSILNIAGISESTPYITYTQPTTLDGMVDVMTDSKSAESAEGQVAFTLAHRLFAFDVVLINEQTDSKREITVNSAKIEFADINSEAKFYFQDGTDDDTELDYTASEAIALTHEYSPVTVPAKTGTVQVAHNFNQKTVDGNVVADPFLLIPCAGMKVKVTLDITTPWGEQKEYVYDHLSEGTTPLAPATGVFKAGYKYRLNITKTDKGVEYAWSVEDWTSKDVPMEFN